MVSGSPTSVLRFPAVRSTDRAPSRAPVNAAAHSSFVVVLPFEPVTPMTLPAKRARAARARSPSAVRASATPMTGTPAQPAGTPRAVGTTTAAAPAWAAAAQNSNPSTRSPGSAKNRRPGVT
jgi:hypothetical protein